MADDSEFAYHPPAMDSEMIPPLGTDMRFPDRPASIKSGPGRQWVGRMPRPIYPTKGD